jgi:uncharacterized membrane protein YdjX (TVP38/TMEM64 family)
MAAKKSRDTGGRYRLAIAALAVAALVALSIFLPVAEWAEQLENELVSKNFLLALALFTAAYVAGTLLFAPGWVFPVVAGAAFGLVWGMLAAIAASLAAASIAFLAARHFLRGPVKRRADKHRLFKQLDRAVAKDGWKVVAMLRLTPVLPFAVKNYFLGLTRIGFVPYVAATAAGMLPGLLVKVYLGAVGRAALGMRDPLQWTMLALGLAASVALMLWLGRFARERLSLAFPKLP